MAFTVKINSIELNKKEDGRNGPYECDLIKYVFKGQEKQLRVFQATLKKYPNLKGDLSKIKKGDDVGLELSDNGQGGKELCRVVLNPQTYDKKTTVVNGVTTTGSRSDYEVGQQVGNALTNACQSLERGATLAQIKKRIWELILLGQETKERIARGEHISSNPPSEPKQDEDQYPETNEDIPF